jgi:hypothetical protein
VQCNVVAEEKRRRKKKVDVNTAPKWVSKWVLVSKEKEPSATALCGRNDSVSRIA